MHKSEFNSSIKSLWIATNCHDVENIHTNQIKEVIEGGISVKYGFTFIEKRVEFYYWTQCFRTEREARQQAIRLLQDKIQWHKDRLAVSQRKAA